MTVSDKEALEFDKMLKDLKKQSEQEDEYKSGLAYRKFLELFYKANKMTQKRNNFYPNGKMIDFRLPQDFRQSQGRGGSCRNCGQYSNKRSFCNIYKSFGAKDVTLVIKWRP